MCVVDGLWRRNLFLRLGLLFCRWKLSHSCTASETIVQHKKCCLGCVLQFLPDHSLKCLKLAQNALVCHCFDDHHQFSWAMNNFLTCDPVDCKHDKWCHCHSVGGWNCCFLSLFSVDCCSCHCSFARKSLGLCPHCLHVAWSLFCALLLLLHCCCQLIFH